MSRQSRILKLSPFKSLKNKKKNTMCVYKHESSRGSYKPRKEKYTHKHMNRNGVVEKNLKEANDHPNLKKRIQI